MKDKNELEKAIRIAESPDMKESAKAAAQAAAKQSEEIKQTVALYNRLLELGSFNIFKDDTGIIKQTKAAKYLVLLQSEHFKAAPRLKDVADEIEFFHSQEWRDINDMFPDMQDIAMGMKPFQRLELFRELRKAAPFIKNEIRKYKNRTQAESVSFSVFVDELLPLCIKMAETTPLLPALPDKHTMLTAKVVNVLPEVTDGMTADEPLDITLNLSNHGNMKGRLMILLDDNIKFTGKPFTAYDREVMNSVATLLAYGSDQHIITADMVYREMNGKKQTEKVGHVARQKVEDSIEKMRHIFVRIDVAEEFRKRKISTDPKIPPLDGYILAPTGVPVRSGGEFVKGYFFPEMPILYKYSKTIKHLVTIDPLLLDIKHVDKNGNLSVISVRSDQQLITIRGYLLHRLHTMIYYREKAKDPATVNTVILFDDLFSKAEVNVSTKQYKANARKTAFLILDNYKARNEFKDYEIIKRSKNIAGVKIIF